MIRFFKNDIFSEPGSEIRILYSPVVNKDGSIDLVESGKENLREYINSFFYDCDIATMIQRFTAGEIDVFDKNKGFFADVTSMPKTYAEFLQLRIDADKAFYDLPVSVRESFDNDSNKFFATIGSDEWNDKMRILNKAEEKIEEEGEKE